MKKLALLFLLLIASVSAKADPWFGAGIFSHDSSSSSSGGGSSGIAIGTTAITGGTSGSILYNNSGLAGNEAVVPVASGGTGTNAPGLVAGTNVTITGTWPNQTITSTASAPGAPGGSSGQVQYNNAGAFGGLTLGCGLVQASGTLSSSQCPNRSVVATTDTITSADAGKIIVYTNASAIAVSSASAASAGLTQGFAVSINNTGAGTVTWTPTGSTINGAASFAFPANTGCYVYSDGTNYRIDFSSCSSLPLSSGVLPANVTYRTVGVTIDGGGVTPGTGVKGYYRVPFSGTITGYSLQSDISGSAVVNVWKLNAAIPTVTNKITASAPPTLSSAQYLNSTTLTGWTTSVAVGDVIGFNVDSISTLTRVTLQLYITTN